MYIRTNVYLRSSSHKEYDNELFRTPSWNGGVAQVLATKIKRD